MEILNTPRISLNVSKSIIIKTSHSRVLGYDKYKTFYIYWVSNFKPSHFEP